MTDDHQPIQTTAAVAHLRYTARRVAINERIEAIAHRTATFYRHDEARGHEYMFKRHTLLDFAAKLLADAKPTLRLPEPMTDADVFAAMDRHKYAEYDLARAIEAETMRRVLEANNG